MAAMTKQQQIAGLVAWLVVVFMVAAIGAAASVQAGPFYAQLVRPGWAPPASVFGPVWSLLYALMGISAWLVWRTGGFREAKAALGLSLLQLVAPTASVNPSAPPNSPEDTWRPGSRPRSPSSRR